jgi:hypothetical protein
MEHLTEHTQVLLQKIDNFIIPNLIPTFLIQITLALMQIKKS